MSDGEQVVGSIPSRRGCRRFRPARGRERTRRLTHLIRVQVERNAPDPAGTIPTVMGILHRAALKMVYTVQGIAGPDLPIGLLRDRIGCQPRLLASSLP